MTIEVYYSPYCPVCGGIRQGRNAVGIVWKDVTCHVEEAVRHGVITPPAVIVDGQLVAQGADAPAYLAGIAPRPED